MGRTGAVRRSQAGAPGGDDTAPVPVPMRGVEDERGRWSAGRVAGPLLLALAALIVLGAAFFVLARDDETGSRDDGVANAVPSPSARLTSGQSTEASGDPSTTPRPSRRPLTLTQATPTSSARPTSAVPTPPRPTVPPAPTPVPTPAPPPPEFSATVHVCRSLSGSSCDEEVRRIGRRDDVVVLLAVLRNAQAGDVIGFEVSGRSGTFDAGSVALEGGGDGYAYVEYATAGLRSGEYLVIATRNGEGVARTAFVKRGG